MWLISFIWFKQNCGHLEYDFDFNKGICTIKLDRMLFLLYDKGDKNEA